MKLPTDMTVFQNAWVVENLEDSIAMWVEKFKVGPFFILDHSGDITDVKYRGKPGELAMRLAIAQAGPVQIELIEPLGDSPNCYRDLIKPGESGFHHMCVWTHDIDADNAYYESLGFPVANEGKVLGSIRFAYYDTSSAIGCMTEVMEYSEAIVGLFKVIADAAVDWDGSDPIRSLE